MSILLTVAALIFVSVLPGKEANDPNQKNINSTNKLQRVEEAMRSFMAANGRRPCPADGQYAENTANFGVEAATPGTCTGGTPNAPLGPDSGTGYVVGGTIPTKTLGLDDSYMYDDYGHRLTYVVDRRATDSFKSAIGQSTTAICPVLEGLTSTNFNPTGTGGIQIESTTGGTVIDNVMYAYISHGVSGYGAWPEQVPAAGGAPANRINSGSTDVDMQTNAGVDALGATSTFTYSTSNFTNKFVQKDRVAPTFASGGTDTGFDDVVWYRPDLKNTCCLGQMCVQKGFIVNGYKTGGSDADYNAAVATGDVNGDGIADLIIGFPDTTDGNIYVVFGTKNGFPDPLPLSTCNGNNCAEFDAGAATDYGGFSVAAGDVNGDGIADLLIGEGSGAYAMPTIVIYGHSGTWNTTSQTINAAFLNGTNGLEYYSAVAGATGGSVAVGDVNGDGIGDIIMGGPWNNTNTGTVYVVFGSTGAAALPTPTATATSGSNTVTVSSTAGLAVGQSVYMNPCFYTSNAITAINVAAKTITVSPHAATNCGPGQKLYIVGWQLNSTVLNGTTGVEYDGQATNQYAGYSLAAGDVNGDGIADIIIGVYGGNFAGVVFGQHCGGASSGFAACTTPNTLNGTFLNGTNGVYYSAVAQTGGLGSSVAAGDVNGDGIADILIGAMGSNPPGPCYSCGKAFLVFGQQCGGVSSGFAACTAGQSLSAAFLNGTNGVEFDAVSSLSPAYVGAGVGIGDVNGDGIGDVLLNSYSSGYRYVVFGKKCGGVASGFAACTSPQSLSAAFLNGTNGALFSGSESSNDDWENITAGDINGDGIADIITGTGATSPGGVSHAGQVYVYFGHKQTINNPWPTTSFSLGGL